MKKPNMKMPNPMQKMPKETKGVPNPGAGYKKGGNVGVTNMDLKKMGRNLAKVKAQG